MLESLVALAAFIPVVIGMGGNIGTQSSTIVVRGLATGRIELANTFKVIFKEVRVGLILGIFYVFVSRQVGRLPLWTIIARPALSGVALGVYVSVLRWIPLLVLVPSAAVVYVVVLYGLGGIPPDEIAKLKQMVPVRWLSWVEK